MKLSTARYFWLFCMTAIGILCVLPARATCIMCSAYADCYPIEMDAFVNCSHNACSGNCKNRPPCPELPCYLSPQDEGMIDNKTSAAGQCGSTTTAQPMISTRAPHEILELSGRDTLLFQAALRFEQLARLGALSESGTYRFSIAQDGNDMNALLSGKALARDPRSTPTTGFAEYSTSPTGASEFEVTLRVWKLAYPSSVPVDGATLFLRYFAQGRSMTLLGRSALHEIPAIRSEYVTAPGASPPRGAVQEPAGVAVSRKYSWPRGWLPGGHEVNLSPSRARRSALSWR